MSSALTVTKTRGQPERPLKVCDALGPSWRAPLRTLFLEATRGCASVRRKKRQGHS